MLSLIERVLGFFYRIFLVRQIGALGLGLYQVAFSLFFLLGAITSSGLPITVSKQTAKFTELGDFKRESATVTASIVIGTFISVFICILLLVGRNLFSFLFTDIRCYGIFLLSLPAFVLSGIYSSMRGGLWGKKKYFAFSFTETCQELIIVIVGIALVLSANDMLSKVKLASISVSIAYFISTIITLVFYLKLGGRFSSPKNEIMPLIKSSTPITAIRICASVVQSLIAIILPMRLVVGGMSMEGALAEYGIVMGMTMPLLFLPSTIIGSLALVLIPEIAKMNLNGDKTELRNKLVSAINISIFIAGLMLPTLLVFSSDITQLLFKNEQAGTYLRYACFLMIPMSISQISSSLLNSLELEKKSFKNYLVGAVLLITLAWILPAYIKIYGLIIAYAVSITTTAFLNMLSLTRHIEIKSKVFKSISLVVLFTIPSSLISFFVFGILNVFIPKIIALVFSVLLSITAYISLMFVFNIVSKEQGIFQRFLVHKKLKQIAE